MLRLQIKNIIKKHNLSLTKHRKKVLKAFLKSAKPLSLSQIQILVGYIDRVTLFRILSVFEEKKVIHVIRLENGRKLFALCDSTCHKDKHVHDHFHFQCKTCDDVSCVPIKNQLTLNIPEYIIHNVDISITGICTNCIS